MTTQELEIFYQTFVKTVGEETANKFFHKASKAMKKDKKDFSKKINMALLLL